MRRVCGGMCTDFEDVKKNLPKIESMYVIGWIGAYDTREIRLEATNLEKKKNIQQVKVYK